MAASSVLVPIIVAVIGIVGTLAPVYISNNVFTATEIDTGSYLDTQDNKTVQTMIVNIGNAPATNLSIYLKPCAFRPCPYEIHNITNDYSTAHITLPQFNNTSLEPGIPLTINRSFVEIRVGKLVPRNAIALMSYVNNSNPSLDIDTWYQYAVYDQGSTGTYPLYSPLLPDYVKSIISWYRANVAPLLIFYAAFYTVFFLLLSLYIIRRKNLKKFLANISWHVMVVRRVLLSDPLDKDSFSEQWFEVADEKRRQAIKKYGRLFTY